MRLVLHKFQNGKNADLNIDNPRTVLAAEKLIESLGYEIREKEDVVDAIGYRTQFADQSFTLHKDRPS